MARKRQDESTDSGIDTLLDEILVDADGDDEQLWAFRELIENNVDLPADAFVIGESVSVVAIDYDGNPRRGLTASCNRADGSRHLVSLAEVRFAEASEPARYAAAYRKWLGVGPLPPVEPGPAQQPRRHKVRSDDVDLSQRIELVVLAVKETAARCRILGGEREITLRSSGLWNVVPGEVVTVQPRKQWSYAGHPYLSGNVEKTRLDVAALGLVPLRLHDQGPWDPADEYWGEEGEPIDEWAQPIIARGPRPMFEMEQVLPGADAEDPDIDPIVEANDLKAAGQAIAARKILMDLLAADLRCLDAHAHLGNFVFDHIPKEALRHYEVGVRIGELSLGERFDGVLAWGLIDNRPFLRCLQGYGLCLWRLGRLDEAAPVFGRMLWLNPSDNQGVRFLLPAVRAGEAWDPQGAAR